MSRLFKFMHGPCAHAQDKNLVAAIADWLSSSERMRFNHETEKADKQPGVCHLCGESLPEAFLVMHGGAAHPLAKSSKHFERIRSTWIESETGAYTADNGQVSQIVPMFFCARACSGPTKAKPMAPDFFSLAEAELRKREREAKDRERAAEKAGGPEAKTVRTKGAV